MSLIILVDK